MKDLTTKELQRAERLANKIWHKFTDGGTQINTPWLMEYEKQCDKIREEK